MRRKETLIKPKQLCRIRTKYGNGIYLYALLYGARSDTYGERNKERTIVIRSSLHTVPVREGLECHGCKFKFWINLTKKRLS